MPVEIRELVIRTSLEEESGRLRGRGRGRGGDRVDPEAIVEECVRQILKILETSRER